MYFYISTVSGSVCFVTGVNVFVWLDVCEKQTSINRRQREKEHENSD